MTTPQDFERLSAYLDQQLSPGEAQRLEARLAAEPELRAALADLRLMHRALRELPAVKAPRNFTLTRAQAEAARRPRGGFPALRLAAAFAALALAVVVIGDVGTMLLAPRGAVEPAAAPMAQSLPLTPTAEETLRMTAPTGQPETGAGGAPLATPAPDATAEAAAGAAAFAPPTPTSEGGMGIASAVTETPAVAAAEAAATPEPATDTSAFYAAATEAAADAPPARPAPLPPIRYVEAALAVLAVLLGLAAWRLRR